MRSPPARWYARWFAGLTWRGVGLVLLVCFVDGFRRSVQNLIGGDPLPDWLLLTARTTGTAFVVGLPVALAVVTAYNLAPRKPAWRYTVIALALVLSSFAGAVGAVGLDTNSDCGLFQACPAGTPVATLIFQKWVRTGSLCALFTVVFVYLRIASESAARALQAERDRAMFVQRSEEARLRMLQAQIEPHFLFNTLANVRRLYQTDPADAATMLDNLMRYLEVALPQMRASDSTLGREAALTQSYLNVQKTRMGRRLAFDVDVPFALAGARLPPMMLVTLAENAIKHGLAPLPEGGHVGISAAVTGGELQVRGADSGRGFTQSSGGGTGLANIRARLAAMYGAAGRLTLALNTPHGVIATLTLPLSSVGSAPGAD